MTLTITLASTTAIYQASDFRLTYAVAGSAADTSFKSLAVGGPKWAGWTWSALITYSGLGQVGVTDTSQWLFSLLKEKAHTFSLNDAIKLICTSWPGFVRRTRQDWDHTFIIGAFDDDTARVLMLSNSTRLNPHCPGGTERLPEILNDLAVTEDAPSDGSVYITGSGAPYILAESNELARLSKRLSRDPSGTRLIFQRLSSVTKTAAARTSTVSEGCWCASLTADGSGAGSVFGIPGARYTPPTLRYPLPDSVAMERVIEDLQQNVLRPQREALVDFTRKKCAEFATELNRERKRAIIQQSVGRGWTTFNSHDAIRIAQITMGQPLHDTIQATTSDHGVADVVPVVGQLQETGCSPSAFEVRRIGPGTCDITFTDQSAQSLTVPVNVYPSLHRAYIVNYAENSVSVIDTGDVSVLRAIDVRSNPTAIAINPTGSAVYVSQDVKQPNEGPGSIAIIDPQLNKVVGTVEVGVAPSGLAINRAGTLLYVSNMFSADITVVDTVSRTVTDWMSLGGLPVNLVLDPTGLQLYVLDGQGHQVLVVDTLTNAVIDILKVGQSPVYAAVNHSGSHLYVVNQGSNNLSIIDLRARTVAATVAVGSSPKCVAISRSATRAYVTNQVSNSVTIVDTFTGKIISNVPVGKEPFGVAVDPSDKCVYIANSGDNNVSVLDAERRVVVLTVVVGKQPLSIGQFIH